MTTRANLEAHLATLTPGERLFRGIHRWQVGDVHRNRLKALGLPHHRVRDSRHFYAVLAVRAGTPYELVARQLGHADIQMVARVYGKYGGAMSVTAGRESPPSRTPLERRQRKRKKSAKWVPQRVPHFNRLRTRTP